MAFNEETAQRIRMAMDLIRSFQYTEKKMFGGLSFLYEGKMTVGVVKDDLAVRVVSDKMEQVLAEAHVRPMDFTKSPMKEFVYVSAGGFETEEQLMRWINLGIEHAKSKIG
ncbi:MAG: TfoX/Sxy family protein [Marinoscillum sp.]|uniref:TfoX/Sxy family protein n=1 Tax=Marinoscillum sp. TaxID=2024838 RepID=UPI0032FA239E